MTYKINQELADLFKKYDSPISLPIRMAQFIVESGAGSSPLFKKSNNGFGIKASHPWTGEKVLHNSPEVGGNQDSYFRKYPTFEDSVKDHANFFTSTPERQNIHYKKAIEATTYEGEAKALTGVYAGDPNYADKLLKAIQTYDLAQFESTKGVTMNIEQACQKLGLKLSKDLLPLTKTFGRVNRKQGIVLHQTGAPGVGQNARAMANYQRNMSKAGNPEEKSWNYQVDDKEAIMSFDHDVATWQSSDGTGPGNTAHIAIESCINADGNYAKAIDNTCKLMACICYVEGFNPHTQIKRHYDFARDKKWCPAQIMNGKDGFTFDKVKQMTANYLAKLKDVGNANDLPTDFDLPKYQTPVQAFKKLEKGDTVTIRSPHNFWYIPENNKGRKPSKDFAKTQDKIVDMKDVNVSYSKRAYLLEKYRSWILEQDLVEARNDWKEEAVEEQEELQEEEFVKIKIPKKYIVEE